MHEWLPPSISAYMVAAATRLRLAGDWRGACAAANVVVHPSAEPVEDLRHLAPDLLWWYASDGAYALLRHDGTTAVVASATSYGGPRRIELTLRPGGRPGRSLLPYQWDARHTADLRARCGGAERIPFFDTAGRRLPPEELGAPDPAGTTERALALHESGRAAAAWATAGFDLQYVQLEPERVTVTPVTDDLAWIDKVLSGLRRPIHAVLAPPRPTPIRLEWPGWCQIIDWPAGARPRARLLRTHARTPSHLEREAFGAPRTSFPLIDASDFRCPPEVARLFSGKLTRAELHPLLQAALFPAAAPVPLPPPKPLRDRVRVHCAGAIHEIVMHDGRLRIPHTDAEVLREQALATLGGRLQGCFAAAAGWPDPKIRMPRQMRTLRSAALSLVHHGDPDAMAAALDRGLDPTLRDDQGRTLLHLLPYFPGTALLPRLLAAGLDPTAKDGLLRTPLQRAEAAGREDLAQAFRAQRL
ncbi:hypothetical protein [Dactylosporangium sp. CA-139066]|uniref:hypothetical protein n=1 Tax=Dactylosporangium sp. CA-139066 TaxID=3239930 RepID=UPI003D8AFCD6